MSFFAMTRSVAGAALLCEIVVHRARDAHLDRHVGACDAAQATADAPLLFDDGSEEVSLRVDLLAQGEDLLRAGVDAQLAPFAEVAIDEDLGHRAGSFLS